MLAYKKIILSYFLQNTVTFMLLINLGAKIDHVLKYDTVCTRYF